MWRCSKCNAEVADSHQTCWVCGTSADGLRSVGLPPPQVMATVADEPARRPPRPQVGMPRRFGIATLMILTAAFAVLLSFLKTIGADPAVFLSISIFVAGITACQAILYKGRNPRKASFVGGYIVGALMAVAAAIVASVYQQDAFLFVVVLGVGLLEAALFGGPLGYVVGCIVAGIFLAWKDRDPEPTGDEATP